MHKGAPRAMQETRRDSDMHYSLQHAAGSKQARRRHRVTSAHPSMYPHLTTLPRLGPNAREETVTKYVRLEYSELNNVNGAALQITLFLIALRAFLGVALVLAAALIGFKTYTLTHGREVHTVRRPCF